MEKYRVTVERLTPAADGVGDDYTTIVELTASREQLAGFAPGVVAEALGTDTVTVTREPAGPRPADEDDTEPGGEQPPAAKRKRRTKAEIAEAEAAAAALAKQQAESAAPAAEGPAPQQPVPAEQPLAAGGVIAQPANQTPAFTPPAAAPAPAPASQPGGYNPFIKN